MNRDEWIEFIEGNPPISIFLIRYCIHKGKDEALSQMFIPAVLDAYGTDTLIRLKDEAYNALKEEFNFTELTNEEGHLLKIY